MILLKRSYYKRSVKKAAPCKKPNMGPLCALTGLQSMEKQKDPHPQNLSHIFYNYENWHSHTLPKVDPKNI